MCLSFKSLSPSALTKDVIKVKGDGLFFDKSLNFSFKISRQDPHECLGSKSVLGSLLVISLWHVTEHGVSSLVDVMDDFAKVGLEVSGGKILKVGQSCSWDISLPLQSSLAFLNHLSELGVFLHVLNKGLCNLQLISKDSSFASAKSILGLFFIRKAVSGKFSSLAHVGSESDKRKVFSNIVHDLGLEEDLGSIIHNFVTQLGFSNVFSQLLDTSTSSLSRSIFVNNLVAFSLGSFTISSKFSNKLLDDLKLSSEESIFVRVHLVSVHLEQRQVHARNSLNKTFKRSRNLEFLVKADRNTASGGSGETNLVIDNDGSVDGSSNKSADNDVIVSLKRSSRVADWNSHVNQSWVLLLEFLNVSTECLDILDFNFLGILVDQHTSVFLHFPQPSSCKSSGS